MLRTKALRTNLLRSKKQPASIPLGAALPEVGLIDHKGEPWRLDDHPHAPTVLIFHRHLA